MSIEAKPRVWLEIDHSVVRDNFRSIAERVRPADILAVLKADAYGLGSLEIAGTLLAAGAARIGVAEPSEAYPMLSLGRPIQIMSAVLPDELPDLIRNRITVPVTDLAMAKIIGETAKKVGVEAIGHIKLDTGMGRLGILIEEADEVVPACCAVEGLKIEGVFTHFPMAYKQHGEITERQIRLFRELLARLEARGITFRYRHCANSDAINNCAEAAQPPFNMVRAGLNLHGLFDPDGARAMSISPVMTLKTRLVAVRDMPEGRTIGYGATCRLFRPTRVGTISAGYADGLPLALSNRGYVVIRGCKCPVLGRLSMDYTTVSLDQLPDAEIGDEVICFGGGTSGAMTPEEWGNLKGTHPYDIICSISPRVRRVHINREE